MCPSSWATVKRMRLLGFLSFEKIKNLHLFLIVKPSSEPAKEAISSSIMPYSSVSERACENIMTS